MSLIKSISGIRGTIGGAPGKNLSPLDVVKFTAAYALWLRNRNPGTKPTVVVGRDGRISGMMIEGMVTGTLAACGINVKNSGLSTTPTVEMAVINRKAQGGIILTASHNPQEWNALKLLNEKGEFISASDGAEILRVAGEESFDFVGINEIGTIHPCENILEEHINQITGHDLVDLAAIRKARFKVVVDAINSTGASAVPALLKALCVKEVIVINAEINGKFAHNPEPLPEHLTELCEQVKLQKADLGIAVDPDVDRLCFVAEDGTLFGEEYTLVAIADYVLQRVPGNTVSNMSSTRALQDVTRRHGGTYTPSAVGEVNVVEKMKATGAVIGGEGNGGIIIPDLHYGRDALIGIALFLSHLAYSRKKVSDLRKTYPEYVISKNKVELDDTVDLPSIFGRIKEKYADKPINTEDGLKIEFNEEWVHLRSSNTEPIIRIYAESKTAENASALAEKLMKDIKDLRNS